jgi:hypothetical protein
MSLTTYLGNKLLDHAAGRTSFTMPTAYLALFKTAPGISGSGTECAYTGYARQAIGTGGASVFGAAASLSSSNTSAISFPTKTAGTDETVGYWATFDALTVGNMLEFGTITVSKLIADNDTPSFAIGQLTRTAS